MVSTALIIFWGSALAFADPCGQPELVGSSAIDSRVLATSLDGRGMPEILVGSLSGLQLLAPGISISINSPSGKFPNQKHEFALGGPSLYWKTPRGIEGCPVTQCSTTALVVPLLPNERLFDMLATGKNLFVLHERRGGFVLTQWSGAGRTTKELVSLPSGAMPALNRSGRPGSVILTSLLMGEPPTWRSTLYGEGATDLVALPRLDQGPWNYSGVALVQGQVFVNYVATTPASRNKFKAKIAGGSWELEIDSTDREPLLAEVVGSNEEKASVTLLTLSRGGRGVLAKYTTVQIQTGARLSEMSRLVPGDPEAVEGSTLLFSQPSEGTTRTRKYFGIDCDGF